MCCKLKRKEGLGQLTQLEECSVVVYDASEEIDVEIVNEYWKCAICGKYLRISDNYTYNYRDNNRWLEVPSGFMRCTIGYW